MNVNAVSAVCSSVNPLTTTVGTSTQRFLGASGTIPLSGGSGYF